MSVRYRVVLTYVQPLEAIDAQITAHVEWLKQGYALAFLSLFYPPQRY